MKMILIEPNPEHKHIDIHTWCENQFGPSSNETWGLVVPELVYMFIQEEDAVMFSLRFGGEPLRDSSHRSHSFVTVLVAGDGMGLDWISRLGCIHLD